MTASEYIAGAFVLVGVSFIFIDIAFRIERKLEPDSVIDFFDAIKLLFFAVGFGFALLALNFGRAVVAGTVSDMSSIFDTTIIIYTLTMSLLVVFGFIYVFVIIPRMLKKLQIKQRREEEEV